MKNRIKSSSTWRTSFQNSSKKIEDLKWLSRKSSLMMLFIIQHQSEWQVSMSSWLIERRLKINSQYKNLIRLQRRWAIIISKINRALMKMGFKSFNTESKACLTWGVKALPMAKREACMTVIPMGHLWRIQRISSIPHLLVQIFHNSKG